MSLDKRQVARNKREGKWRRCVSNHTLHSVPKYCLYYSINTSGVIWLPWPLLITGNCCSMRLADQQTWVISTLLWHESSILLLCIRQKSQTSPGVFRNKFSNSKTKRHMRSSSFRNEGDEPGVKDGEGEADEWRYSCIFASVPLWYMNAMTREKKLGRDRILEEWPSHKRCWELGVGTVHTKGFVLVHNELLLFWWSYTG